METNWNDHTVILLVTIQS